MLTCNRLWLSFCFLSGLASAQGVYVEEARLVATSPTTGSYQGTDVDIDGATAVVGAPLAGPGQGGTATVYVRSLGTWSVQGELVASDGANGNNFGAALAVYGDSIAVGASGSTVSGQVGAGAVYIFTRAAGVWTLQQKLIASDVLQNAEFGHCVALDGNTLAVGSPNQNSQPLYPGSGATYVFTRTNGVWTQQQRIVPGGNQYGARSGSSVALEGASLLIGARSWTDQVTTIIGVGRVFEFTRLGAVWTQAAEFGPADQTQFKLFGSSLDLHGNYAVVGAPNDALPGQVAYGSAYVFVRSGGGWSQQQKLHGQGIDDQDYFGTDVGIHGGNIVVGAINANSSAAAGSGSVRWFVRSGWTWSEQPDLYGSQTVTGDKLGEGVAISGDTVLAGANFANTATGIGETYVWRISPAAVSIYCTAKTNSLGCVPSIGSSGTPSVSSPSPFFVTCTQVISQKQGLMFYGFQPASAPFQGGTMCVQPPTLRLAVSNSGGSPSGADCSGVYSYDFNARTQSGADPLLVAGAVVYGQFWMRDPGSPSTTGLSNALQATVQP